MLVTDPAAQALRQAPAPLILNVRQKSKMKRVATLCLLLVVAFFAVTYLYRIARAERYSVLDRACASGNVARASLIIHLGADPNGVRDLHYYMNYGWRVFEPTPPLFAAAYQGHFNVVKLLLENGANPYVRGIDGMTPLDAARARGHLAVANAIEAAMK